MDILCQAEKLQARALAVVDTLRLCEFWGRVGATYHVGASRTGLMMRPNIDFETYVETPKAEDGFRIMTTLASSFGVKRVSYFDFMQSDDPGLYWWFEYQDADGMTWDFDHWLIPNSHPHAGMADRFASRLLAILTDPIRVKILSIKKETADLSPQERPRGIDIYKAVLKDGVSSYEDFVKWTHNNPPVSLETWMP